MHVSEIRVNQIRVNQGLGVIFCCSSLEFHNQCHIIFVIERPHLLNLEVSEPGPGSQGDQNRDFRTQSQAKAKFINVQLIFTPFKGPSIEDVGIFQGGRVNIWSNLPMGGEGTFPSQIHLKSQIHLNYSVIVPCFSSPSQKENLLNAFSNQNVGKYSTFSNGNTFSAPSQMEYMFYISRNLLRFFSMEIPSQLLLK